MARPIEETRTLFSPTCLRLLDTILAYMKSVSYIAFVELAQAELQGKDFVEWIGMKVETNLFGDKDINASALYSCQ